MSITTAVVGSYPQPDWLVDKSRYRSNVVPRVRMPELWRVAAGAWCPRRNRGSTPSCR
jgi:5-methyltetrahydropteroyltriglutamate--homocysteine methyltransferase